MTNEATLADEGTDEKVAQPERKTRTAQETQTYRESALLRLSGLGFSEEEIAEFEETEFSDEELFELVTMSNAALRAAIIRTRAEGAYYSQTEDEAAAEYAVALEDAGAVIGESVSVVLDWVGVDPLRARAALELERQAPTPRTTLTGPLEDLLGDAPVA